MPLEVTSPLKPCPVKDILSLLTSLLFLLPFLCVGQTKSISGKVISEDLHPLPFVSIKQNNGNLLGKTDMNGIFKIDIPSDTAQLFFSFVGYEPTQIKLIQECQQIEVILQESGSYDFMSNSKIERIRKRLFNKLPQLHKQAVTKGLFSDPNPCYDRKFNSHKAGGDSLAALRKVRIKAISLKFDKLKIGDTVMIPYSGLPDRQNKTRLYYCSATIDRVAFECVIKGVILQKDNASKGLNFTYKVIDNTQCQYPNITLDGRNLTIGDTFRYNMKHFKVL